MLKPSDMEPSTSIKRSLGCSQSGSKWPSTPGSFNTSRRKRKSESSDRLSPRTRCSYAHLAISRSPKAVPPTDEIGDLHRHFVRLNDRVSACAGGGKLAGQDLPTYQVSLSLFFTPDEAKARPLLQWLTVLPQLVSRILHPNERVVNTLEIILLKVLRSYPHHGFWAMASGAKSMTNRRSKRNTRVFQKAKVSWSRFPSSCAQLLTASTGRVPRPPRAWFS